MIINSENVVDFKLEFSQATAVRNIKFKIKQKKQVNQKLIFFFQVWNKLDLKELKFQAQIDRAFTSLDKTKNCTALLLRPLLTQALKGLNPFNFQGL